MNVPVSLSLITATHHRTHKLTNIALPSVLAQTVHNFEWIIVNDGRDRSTRDAAAAIEADFALTYLEMDHQEDSFSLCHARNLGLKVASGSVVAYLDDDNSLTSTFVEEILKFFQSHPSLKCSMVCQNRRRDIVREEQILRSGKPFIAPSREASTRSLIWQDDLFDSNGFAHYRQDAPWWNPKYRVFADYEYFLQCVSLWGQECFALNPLTLVNYTQSSEGEIGRSNYQQWARELREIYLHHLQYPVLGDLELRSRLTQLIHLYEEKSKRGLTIPAFSKTKLV